MDWKLPAYKALEKGRRILKPSEIIQEGDKAWVWTDHFWSDVSPEYIGLEAETCVAISRAKPTHVLAQEKVAEEKIVANNDLEKELEEMWNLL